MHVQRFPMSDSGYIIIQDGGSNIKHSGYNYKLTLNLILN